MNQILCYSIKGCVMKKKLSSELCGALKLHFCISLDRFSFEVTRPKEQASPDFVNNRQTNYFAENVQERRCVNDFKNSKILNFDKRV